MKSRLVSGADSQQLRDEFTAYSLTVTVGEPDGQNKVLIEYADDAPEELILRVARSHFPRTHIVSILAVDFEASTTLADLKAKCIQLRNRTALALKARWESDS